MRTVSVSVPGRAGGGRWRRCLTAVTATAWSRRCKGFLASRCGRYRGGTMPRPGGSRPVRAAGAGMSDGLLAADGDRDAGPAAVTSGRISLDEGLLGSWTGAFGWLVLAEMVPPGRLRALAEEAGRRQRVAEASADRFPERA